MLSGVWRGEEKEIKEARDGLDFWESPSFGSLTFMGPGLNLYRGELTELALENSPWYQGYAWLIYLNGDSSLVHLTNSFRLFSKHDEAAAVRDSILATRAQRSAGTAWQRFFANFRP